MGTDSSTPSDIQAAITAGTKIASAEDRVTTIEGVPVGLNSSGNLVVLDQVLATSDRREDAPQRRIGTCTHQELASFVAGVKRFASPASVIFANVANMDLTAVLNYHPAGPEYEEAGWGDHRHVYACPKSPEWIRWTGKNEQPFLHEAFADFIEERADDIVSGDGYPNPLDLVELARDLRIHTRGTYERTVDKRTGMFALVNKLDMEQSSTPIPRAFLIGIPVFLGGAKYRVECRMRLRLEQGKPILGYEMHRKAEFERDAFADVRKIVAEQCGLPVFAGSPEA